MYKNYIKKLLKGSFLFISLSVLLFFFTKETQAQIFNNDNDRASTNAGWDDVFWWYNGYDKKCAFSRHTSFQGTPFYLPKNSPRFSGPNLDWRDGRASFKPPTGHEYFMTCKEGAWIQFNFSQAGYSKAIPHGEYTFTYYVATLPPKEWPRERIEEWKKRNYPNTTPVPPYADMLYAPYGSVDYYTISYSQIYDDAFNKIPQTETIKLTTMEWTKQTFKFTVGGPASHQTQHIDIRIGHPELIESVINPDYDDSNNRVFHISVPKNPFSPATSPTLCKAGTDFPSLSTTTINSKCPTADLTEIKLNSPPPTGTSLTWHTATPPTNANKITGSIKAVTPGTYYAAFYDAVNDCYGNATAVTVTATTNVGTEGPRW